MYADRDETLSIQVLRVRMPRVRDSDAEEALASVKLSLLPLSEYAAAGDTRASSARVFEWHVQRTRTLVSVQQVARGVDARGARCGRRAVRVARVARLPGRRAARAEAQRA